VKDYLVLRVVAKLLIPFILLFGLYTQVHGDYGPGGGFQAGVIFASAFVLYGLVFDQPAVRKVLPVATILLVMPLGLLLYAGTGLASLIGGGNYLEYGALARDAAHGNHVGIFVIELGVGITVACVITTIFYVFAARR